MKYVYGFWCISAGNENLNRANIMNRSLHLKSNLRQIYIFKFSCVNLFLQENIWWNKNKNLIFEGKKKLRIDYNYKPKNNAELFSKDDCPSCVWWSTTVGWWSFYYLIAQSLLLNKDNNSTGCFNTVVTKFKERSSTTRRWEST